MRRRRLRSCGILKRSGGDGGGDGGVDGGAVTTVDAERKEQNRSQLRTHGAKPLRRSHILALAAARLREEAVRGSAVCWRRCCWGDMRSREEGGQKGGGVVKWSCDGVPGGGGAAFAGLNGRRVMWRHERCPRC